MQIYESEISVTQNDIDVRNHVNNLRYVQWVQDISEAHWTSKTSKEIRDTYYWVMLRHHIQYKAEAILGEVLYLKTYVTQSEGVKSTRMVEIYNKNTNKLLTISETIWCFISHKNHRPARITSEIKEIFR